MLPETEGKASGGSGRESPDPGRNLDPVAERSPSLCPVDEGDPREGLESGDGSDTPRSDGPALNRTKGEGDIPVDPHDPGKAGNKVSAPSGKQRHRITEAEVALALREAKGNRDIAAAALGCSRDNVDKWIARSSKLNALHGQSSAHTPGPDVAAPTDLELMTRRDEPLPGLTAGAVDVAMAVAESDAKMMRDGLADMGFKEGTLDKLKKLDGLAKDNGHFMSVSLQTTHRMYFVQLINLMEVADGLKAEFLEDKEDPEKPGISIRSCTNQEKAFFYKCYIEAVKEAGKGYQTMMGGVSAMVTMIAAAKGDDDAADKPGKPAWHKRTTKKKKSK